MFTNNSIGKLFRCYIVYRSYRSRLRTSSLTFTQLESDGKYLCTVFVSADLRISVCARHRLCFHVRESGRIHFERLLNIIRFLIFIHTAQLILTRSRAHVYLEAIVASPPSSCSSSSKHSGHLLDTVARRVIGESDS